MSSQPLEPLDFLPDEPVTTKLAHKQQLHLGILAISLTVLILSALLQVRPDGRVFLLNWTGVPLPESCMTKIATGWPCPGCGLTRCFIYLTHGNLAAAWEVNRAGILVYGLVVSQIPWRIWQIRNLRRGRVYEPTWLMWAAAAVALMPLLNWLLRLLHL